VGGCTCQVVCDSAGRVAGAAACLVEASDLILPIKEGAITEEHIHASLREVVAGLKPGRKSDDEITLFKSAGWRFRMPLPLPGSMILRARRAWAWSSNSSASRHMVACV
jgi:hypothetical protein